LPRHFQAPGDSSAFGSSWWLRPETRFVPTDVNDLNKEDSSRYVRISRYTYLLLLTFYSI
jgi:alpha-1,2-mannosyltransferase